MERSASNSGGRYVDLAISVRIADVEQDAKGRPRWKDGTDVELRRVGGRWDRRRKRWKRGSAATQLLVLRFHRGQESAARWFVDWLTRFVRNDWKGYRRAWSVLLIGGRRSGKTHVACAALIIFAILNPGALLWAISPTLETGDELDQNFKELLPRSWYTRRQAKTGRSTTYRFANGSRILLKSAVKPQRLKAGRVDLVLLNEAQELSQTAYVKVRAPIADRGGLVLMTANPPDMPSGRWVEEHYVAAKSGQIECEVFEFDPQNNPWINYEALASIGKEVDEKTFQRDVLGLFPPIGDVVFFAWSDRDSIRDVPEGFVDITREFTRATLGRAYASVIGIDLQQTPHMAAAVIKFFRDPSEPLEVVPWVVGEVVVEEADENDLIDALELEGYRGAAEPDDDPAEPMHSAVVMDASAWWQDGAHTKGRTSDRAFKARNWVHLYKPQKDSDKNPDIVERVKCTNARLKTSSGRRRLFSRRCNERTNRAMRSWENRGGVPYRKSDYAHLCDAVSYVIYRFFGVPKARKGKKAAYHSVGRFDRGDLYAR